MSVVAEDVDAAEALSVRTAQLGNGIGHFNDSAARAGPAQRGHDAASSSCQVTMKTVPRLPERGDFAFQILVAPHRSSGAVMHNLRGYFGLHLSKTMHFGTLLPGLHATLLQAISKLLLPLRPNGCEPRAVKRRPKPNRSPTKPRHVERARLERRQQRILAAFAEGSGTKV